MTHEQAEKTCVAAHGNGSSPLRDALHSPAVSDDVTSEATQRARQRVREAFASLNAHAPTGGIDPGGSAQMPSPVTQQQAMRPINFNAAMVRALIAGHKTQTRRPIRPMPTGEAKGHPIGPDGEPARCTLAATGDALFVREPWALEGSTRVFEADLGPAVAKKRAWQPGRLLPADASRITLKVTGVKAEKLSALRDGDARAEGMPPGLFDEVPTMWFRSLWDSIYGSNEFAWDADPWVWVISFRALPKGKR